MRVYILFEKGYFKNEFRGVYATHELAERAADAMKPSSPDYSHITYPILDCEVLGLPSRDFDSPPPQKSVWDKAERVGSIFTGEMRED